MEPLPFLPASQPMDSTPSFIFPRLLQGSSSLGLPPGWAGSQPRHDEATDFLNLNLPPNTLRALASGRPPALFNGPAGQPVRTAKTVAAAKRTTARSHSQLNVWRSGDVSAYARGVQVPNPASQSLLPELAQSQPPPVKARSRRAVRAPRARARETSSIVSHQPAITTLSVPGAEQSASQTDFNPTTAVLAAVPPAETMPTTAHAGWSTAAMPSTASRGEEHGESMSIYAMRPFSWATATSVEISRHCGLDYLPLNLIEQVLPRLRAFLMKSGHLTCSDSCESGPAPIPATVVSNASTLHQNPLPPSVEGPEMLHDLQLPVSVSAPEQPISLPPTGHLERAPTTVVPWTEPTDVPEWWSLIDSFMRQKRSHPRRRCSPLSHCPELASHL